MTVFEAHSSDSLPGRNYERRPTESKRQPSGPKSEFLNTALHCSRNCKSVGTLHRKSHAKNFLCDMKREELIERFRAYCSETAMDFSLDDIYLIFTPDRRGLASNFFSSGVIGQTLRQNCLKCKFMNRGEDFGEACLLLWSAGFTTLWIGGWCAGIILASLAIQILPVAIVLCFVALPPTVIFASICFAEFLRFKRIVFRIFCVPISVETQQYYGKDCFLLHRRGLFIVSEEELEELGMKFGVSYLEKDLKVNFFTLDEVSNMRFEVEHTEIPGFMKLTRHRLNANNRVEISSSVLPASFTKKIVEHCFVVTDVF